MTLSDYRRLAPALAAGGIAIALNTAALIAADRLGLATAHGGLLKLLKILGAAAAAHAGLAEQWQPIAQEAAAPSFQIGFHIAVGLLMAVFYAYAVEPALSGRPLFKGLVYAAAVWLLNAFCVLPLIGEGIAGWRHLTPEGMIGFAAIHTLFFVVLALLYGHWRKGGAADP